MTPKLKVSHQRLNRGINKLVEQDLINNQCSQFEIAEINAGTVNDNFFVKDSCAQILFKIFANNHILPIDRNVVLTLQAQLAIVGLAPTPLYLSRDRLYYAEQWINNSHTLLDEKQLREKSGSAHQAIQQLLAPLSQALYNIHNSHVGTPAIDLPKHLQAYWSCIKSPSDKLKQEYKDMLSFCTSYIEKHKSEFVLCHNDLHMDHVSHNSDIIYDWEYASYGCKYYDIASCALINCFDEMQIKQLCAEYAKLIDDSPDSVFQAVQNVRALTEFTFKLWRYAIGQEPIVE